MKHFELDWQELPEDPSNEITGNAWWPIPTQKQSYEIMLSKTFNIVRIITILPSSTTIRYITPFHTWSYSSAQDGTNPRLLGVEHCDIANLPILADTFSHIKTATHNASNRIIAQQLLDKFFSPIEDGISTMCIDSIQHHYFDDIDAPGIARYTGKGRAYDADPNSCAQHVALLLTRDPYAKVNLFLNFVQRITLSPFSVKTKATIGGPSVTTISSFFSAATKTRRKLPPLYFTKMMIPQPSRARSQTSTSSQAR